MGMAGAGDVFRGGAELHRHRRLGDHVAGVGTDDMDADATAFPEDPDPTASVDGASALQSFRYMTLPFIRPYIELGALLGSLFIIQTFDSIYMTTQGGPGQATTNLPFLLYLVAFQGFDVGEASAIGVVAVVVTIIVATFALRSLFTIFVVEQRR